MQHRMVDRWIETAEARRVCEREIGEQRLPVTPIPRPLPLITKFHAMMILNVAHRCHSAAPTAESAA